MTAFAPPYPCTQTSDACQVTAADLDGDGDLDLVSVNRANDRVVWYENLLVEDDAGTAETTPAPLVPTTLSPGSSLSDASILTPSPMMLPTSPTQSPASSVDGIAREAKTSSKKIRVS